MKEMTGTIKHYIGWSVKKPELLFAIFGLIFGLIFIFRLAPLSGTDEFTHFPRLYQISKGIFWEQRLPGDQFGGKLPANVNAMIDDYRDLSRYPTGASYLDGRARLNKKYSSVTEPGKKEFAAVFTSAVIYPPWAYASSLIGLVVAKVLHLPLIWYVYMARISSLFVWLVLGFFAIRILPSGKWFLAALALTPTAVSQAATIGGDGLLMGVSWLLIALVIRACVNKTAVRPVTLLVVLVVAAYSALIKDGYFMLGLLPLAIPLARFSSRRWGMGFKAISIVLILVCSLLFTLRTVHAAHGIVLTPISGMDINSTRQIHYVMHHLPTYIWRVIAQPFTKSFDTTYLGIVGIVTNRLIYLSILIIGIIYACLGVAFARSRLLPAALKMTKWTGVVFLAVFFLTYMLLASAFYVGSTAVGASFVNGFYGRYFLPILPLLLAIPLILNRSKPAGRYVPAAIAGPVIGLIAMVTSLQ